MNLTLKGSKLNLFFWFKLKFPLLSYNKKHCRFKGLILTLNFVLLQLTATDSTCKPSEIAGAEGESGDLLLDICRRSESKDNWNIVFAVLTQHHSHFHTSEWNNIITCVITLTLMDAEGPQVCMQEEQVEGGEGGREGGKKKYGLIKRCTDINNKASPVADPRRPTRLTRP